MSKISAEQIEPQNDSVVSPAIKLDFVLEEGQRLKFEDPEKLEYIHTQIAKARRIMAKEMQKSVGMGLGIENVEPQEVLDIIEGLFFRFVCQRRSR